MIISVFAIALAGCRKSDDTNVIEGTVITELRSHTEKSPNPMNVNNYKLAKSKETLESLTHVSKNRLFYMDYLADFPMEALCKTGSAATRLMPPWKAKNVLYRLFGLAVS